MPALKIRRDGTLRSRQFPEGTRLFDALLAMGEDVGGACGGNGTCGKCLVRLEGSPVPVRACDIRMEGDLTVLSDPFPEFPGAGFSGSVVPGQKCGVAFDLGTTTLVMWLVDLESGGILSVRSMPNPQRSHGTDVITRIGACRNGGLEIQRDLVRQALAGTIARWKTAFGPFHAETVVIAGNTVMSHLFWGISPEGIGIAPYIPAFLEGKEAPGTELGIDAGRVILLPSMSAFLGGDMTAGVLSSALLGTDRGLLVDLGTNGEILLKSGKRIFGCSAATGPAFEGANIECGMGGWPGAVSRISLEQGTLSLETVGGFPAKGICGSGLVDLVSLLLSEGLIDETGAFDPDSPSPLASRLENGRFILGPGLFLSQRDVRQFQLAKAAIRAAVETLLEVSGTSPDSVEKVFLAGGFGSYLDLGHAVRTGILPESFREKTVSVGNSSGAGALLCLNDPSALAKAAGVARSVETVDLMRAPGFNDRFVDRMGF